jgi:hypothetical protein
VAKDDDKSEGGARRVASIVHDERGNARVKWHDIPDDRSSAFQRAPLAIEGDSPLVPRRLAVEDFRSAKGTNPYQRVHTAGRPEPVNTSSTRRDLRKLSEWIKLKREMDARKVRGEPDTEDE